MPIARKLITTGLLLTGALAGSSVRWGGTSPAEAAAIAMLDPSRAARVACTAPGGEPLLRQRLALAAAVAAPAGGAEAMPLYTDVPRSAFAPGGITPAARPWFDQGIEMAYNFNHAAAVAAFRRAQALAPGCALCFWGEALVYGPNINAPMDDGARAATMAALGRARALAGAAPPLDRALIDALALRYSADPKANRDHMDADYADAMLALAARVRGNDDLDVLAAEAAMDTTPWKYWDASRTRANPRIDRAVALVEGVMARNPQHQEAAHLYIHLMENYVEPKRAEAAADALDHSAMPQAGHLVHMPGHIYYRIGRYRDSIRANLAAARADEAYLAQVPDDGLYRYGYYPHNVHFIVASAQQAGDLNTAIAQADKLRQILPDAKVIELGWVEPVAAAPLFAYAQGATPAAILSLPRPDARLGYIVAMWHYARAIAFAQQRDGAQVASELNAMEALEGTPEVARLDGQGVPAKRLIQLAQHVAAGKFAYALGHFDEAAGHYRAALAIEDTIPYQEPPYWYYPVGQSLGAALLRGGHAEAARDAFHQALLRAPGNGWALYGLQQAELALGHAIEARAAGTALERAWLGDPNLLSLDRL